MYNIIVCAALEVEKAAARSIDEGGGGGGDKNYYYYQVWVEALYVHEHFYVLWNKSRKKKFLIIVYEAFRQARMALQSEDPIW